MTPKPAPGNEIVKTGEPLESSNHGFTLVELLFALAIIAGAFVALTGMLPLSSILHRSALEKETALSLAQFQMEHFLTNPGPLVGETGTRANFANAAQFPPGYSGAYSAHSAGGGLTVIVVSVTPPHAPRVEISAIDTTYSNLVP